MIFLTVEPDPSSHQSHYDPDTKRGVGIFCPDRTVHSVLDVDPQELVDLGMKGVILDLDNTLVLWHKEEITEEIVAWLERVKAVGLKLCILSNSVLSNRSERIAERLNCPNVRQARKPSRSGFRRAMNAMGTTPRTTAMIGDQMFTDILGGNRMRLFTIMVTPMNPKEFVYTRYVSRPPERLLLRYFRRRGQI